MKHLKVLPLAAVVAATIASFPSVANSEIEALEKRIAVLESSQASAATDSGIEFTGYARYGAHFENDENPYVSAAGQLAGNAAGRLGNEVNGGEFQFTKRFEGANGTQWDLNVMMENWWKAPDEYGDVSLKKFYAGASNVFKSQPDLYVWAGRDFHQRPQEGLNDYFLMTHDGQGGGFKNMDLGGAKFDLAVVGKTGEATGDNGDYAVTSKFAFSLGESSSMDLLMNYGFSDKGNKADNAFQVATLFNFSGHKLNLRYSDNSDNSAFNRTNGLKTIYASYQSGISLGERTIVDYQFAYHNSDGLNDMEDDRTNYSAIVRPMYAWNDIHSTWLEAGYSMVDYDKLNEKNAAWKVTLSQNISLDSVPWGRPMLRFYTTVGEADNKVKFDGGSLAKAEKVDTLAFGAMFEAWW
ncbi:carbohydrate porin [Vibrio sinaloensis]|uniref:carbohydrate porin n=1 Tax=Photobacterium sp. (strain ATCC 43367) TaxID=379097 RepID=UPI00205D6E42|nr:carbohydrate porin [Vibrio sinaloensis]UPQ90247.1 carbohydrate porin [Vibrio sinaloensis]